MRGDTATGCFLPRRAQRVDGGADRRTFAVPRARPESKDPASAACGSRRVDCSGEALFQLSTGDAMAVTHKEETQLNEKVQFTVATHRALQEEHEHGNEHGFEFT